MGAQDQHGRSLEEHNSDSKCKERTPTSPGNLGSAEDGDRGVPGIEVIIGDTVGYEQGRKPRIMPNRIRRRRKGRKPA